MDDDVGGADTFEALLHFLHHHYFPRLAWSRLTLNPAKSFFFTEDLSILGFTRTRNGIRPSADKLAATRDYRVLTNEASLIAFLHMLPFLRSFILGREGQTSPRL